MRYLHTEDFVNRNKEFEIIRLLLRQGKGLRIQLFCGPAGIGKTTLLREIRYIYSNSRGIAVSSVVDLDDLQFQSMSVLMSRLVEVLDRHSFEPYFKRSDILRELEIQGVPKEQLSEISDQVNTSFIKCFNSLAQRKTIVLLLDSVEMVDDSLLVELVDLVKPLQNTVLIAAGRREGAERLQARARARLKHATVRLHELKEFKASESAEFFMKKKIKLDPKLERNLHLLSKGHPIVLALTAEWVRRGIDLPEVATRSHHNLLVEKKKGTLDELISRFQLALVSHLITSDKPVDLVVLLMSLIDKRFDADILRRLTGFTNEQCKEVLDQLENQGFVKVISGGNKWVLHQQMIEIIKAARIWDRVDPTGLQRRKHWEITVRYYDATIAEVSEQFENVYRFVTNALLVKKASPTQTRQFEYYRQLLQSYEVERLSYARLINVDKTLEYFSQAFDAPYSDSAFQWRLLGEIKHIRDSLPENDQYEIDSRLARWHLFAQNDTSTTENILRRWEGNSSLSRVQELDLLTRLANVMRIRGQLQQAREMFLRARKIASSELLEYEPKMIENLGWVSRLMGRWDEAAAYYEDALRRMRAETVEEKLGVADLVNNLGFVQGLRGDWLSGLAWCQEGLTIREKYGSLSKVAGSLYTLGSVWWAKGDYETAHRHYERVLELAASPLVDRKLETDAYFGRGIAYWFAGRYHEAKVAFETSIKLAKRQGYLLRLPLAVHDLGHVYWELRDVQRAEELFVEGYNLSKQYHDYQALVDTLVGFAELYYELGKLDQIEPLVKELKDLESEGYKFPLFAGRMERILGSIAFDRNDFEEAARLYIDGLVEIAQHGGYGKYRLGEEFLRLGKRLDGLPPSTVLAWCDKLEQRWADEKLEKGLAEVKAFVAPRRAMAIL